MTDARSLTHDLGGKWMRSYGTAPCPVCQPERRKQQNALTLHNGSDGRLLLHCKKHGCSFIDILAAAGVNQGEYRPPDPAMVAKRERAARAEAQKRASQAARCWQEAKPITGTPAERYLRSRGITCELPETLRYHPSCWHVSGKRLPAMVALIEGTDLCAVHRTYLHTDGTGKAEADPVKAMLGSTSGGAVRLTHTQGPIVITEGIETALSLASGLLPPPVTVWAALSTSGMRGLRLSCGGSSGSSDGACSDLIIAPDGDAPGRAAAHDLAARAHNLGWNVTMLPAPDGQDWNDILMMNGAVT